MMKILQQIIAFLVTLVLTFVSPFSVPNIQAASVYQNVLEEDGSINNSSDAITFKNPVERAVRVMLYADATPTVNVTIANEAGEQENVTLLPEQWTYDEEVSGYQAEVKNYDKLAVGKYQISLQSADVFQYKVMVLGYNDFAMVKKQVTVTQGQPLQLKTKGGLGNVKWNSANKKIATVDKKGKVTTKKAGTVVITAESYGLKVNCKVKVKKNLYQVKQYKLKDKGYGVFTDVYQMTQKNGAVVCKLRILNNSPRYIEKFDNITIQVTNKKGKTLAKQKFFYNNSIPGYTTKNLTFTIDKKNVKADFVDLVKAKVSTPVSHYAYVFK